MGRRQGGGAEGAPADGGVEEEDGRRGGGGEWEYGDRCGRGWQGDEEEDVGGPDIGSVSGGALTVRRWEGWEEMWSVETCVEWLLLFTCNLCLRTWRVSYAK